MKGMVLYLAVMAGGGVAGAAGVGAYNVFVVGLEADAVVAEEEGAETHAEAEPGAEDPQDHTTEAGDEVAHAEDADPEATAGDPEVLEDQEVPTDLAEVAEANPEESLGEATGGAVGGADPAGETVPIDPEELARVQANYQRLARIFMAMKPDEAAPVLAQLDDSQLEGILLAMQGRNAAPILAEMDPARVASISRKVLGGNQ